MLKPNEIPEEEPVINVGIILPEDRYTQIEIELPSNIIYRIRSDTPEQLLQIRDTIIFNLTENKVSANNRSVAPTWRIEPVNQYTMSALNGLKVKKVIAGRGFHWQKTIDVFLPGSIEIKVFNNYLILLNELPLEEYLMCVATSEMGAECPAALIESQTIAARSWILANIEQKHVEMGMDVCNDDCCQRYQGSGNLTAQSIAGARNSTGLVLLYNNDICDARYSKSCGGVMETYQTIWPGTNPGYLKNIPDAADEFTHSLLPLTNEEKVKKWIDDIPSTFCSSNTIPESTLKNYLGSVDEQGKYFRWQITYNQTEMCELLNAKLTLNANNILSINPIKRGGSGRLSHLEIAYQNQQDERKTYIIDSEYNIRQALHRGFLYSSCFYIISENSAGNIPKNFIIKGAGWGHGVGYCQIGALGMALNGYTTAEILAHYYPGSELKKIY